MRYFGLGILWIFLIHSLGMGNESLDINQLKDWKIVVAGDAIPSERYAADEFRSLLKQAVGIDLPIVSSIDTPDRAVLVGPGAASMAGVISGGFGEEEVYLKITPNKIVLAGGRPRGTLYAVYEFMERELGVRFLTFDHTYFPPNPTGIIPCEEYIYRPPFLYRWSYYKEVDDRHDFAARLHINTTPTEEQYGGVTRQRLISHSLGELLPVEKYGKDHPEYYAMVDGERKLVVDYDAPEVCSTNPEVAEVVAENVMRELEAHPDWVNIAVSQNDNDAYCRCPKCEEVNQREETPMGSHMLLVNAVAERVEKKYPNIKIGTLAYWYTRKPPKTIVPRPNVQVQLCSIECCTLHAIDDPNCVQNQSFCQDMEGWGKICKNIFVWNYNNNFFYYDLPFANFRSIGPNIRFFQKNNTKGLFMQANAYGNNGDMCDLRNYLISRCLWNPSLNDQEVIEEFCRLHYGKAADAILEYVGKLCDRTEREGWHPSCFPRPIEMGLTPEFSKELFDIFQKGMALAETPEIRRRVEKASMCAYRAIIERCGQIRFDKDRLWMSWPAPWDLMVDRYELLTKKYNVTKATEHMDMSVFLKQLHRVREEGIPAARLENDTWRLTMVPENGSVMEMTYKPAGRNLAYDPVIGGMGKLFEERSLREHIVKGFDSKEPADYKASVEGSTLTWTRTQSDGSTQMREIELKPDKPNILFCRSAITHQGAEPKVYRIMVQPSFSVGTFTRDYRVLTGYCKDGGWTALDENWREGNNPRQDIVTRSLKGGAMAFFNHQLQFGVAETYEPEKIASVKFRWIGWIGPRPQLGLELITKEAELKKGESFSYAYTLEYLDKPPDSSN